VTETAVPNRNLLQNFANKFANKSGFDRAA
jgi:hypothetical protein